MSGKNVGQETATGPRVNVPPFGQVLVQVKRKSAEVAHPVLCCGCDPPLVPPKKDQVCPPSMERSMLHPQFRAVTVRLKVEKESTSGGALIVASATHCPKAVVGRGATRTTTIHRKARPHEDFQHLRMNEHS